MALNTKLMQEKLKAAGRYTGAIDGVLGPKSYAALLEYGVGKSLGDKGLALGKALSEHLADADITTGLRLAHFLGQAAHETGNFNFLTELGNSSYFKKYDGRADLGNVKPGDGKKFKGRGIFQTTGRANYEQAGKALGLNTLEHPELLAEPENAVRSAVLYWKTRGINLFADQDRIRDVTRKINGGFNGLAEREELTEKFKAITLA